MIFQWALKVAKTKGYMWFFYDEPKTCKFPDEILVLDFTKRFYILSIWHLTFQTLNRLTQRFLIMRQHDFRSWLSLLSNGNSNPMMMPIMLRRAFEAGKQGNKWKAAAEKVLAITTFSPSPLYQHQHQHHHFYHYCHQWRLITIVISIILSCHKNNN